MRRTERAPQSAICAASQRAICGGFSSRAGWHRVSSEQRRQAGERTGGGVRQAAMFARAAAAVVAVSARKPASKGDRVASAGLAVKQGAFRHLAAEHLLQADRLGAELNLVGAMCLGFAAFVLDREGARRTAGEFDDVGDTRDAERQRAQRQPAHDPHPRPALWPARIDPLMQDAALGGGAVLRPQAFDMDQGALPRAEQLMLQRRQWDQRILDLRARKGRGHSGLTVRSLRPLQEPQRCPR